MPEEINFTSLVPVDLKSVKSVMKECALSPEVMLKDYQLPGNWLYLFYRREYSCILAAEMGEWLQFSRAVFV